VGLTATRLAARAGVRVDDVQRLTRLGIVHPGSGPEPYAPSDVHRVRLVIACERSGMSAERIAEAIRRGRLSLSFVTSQFASASPMTGESFRELFARHGVAERDGLAAFEAAGFPAPDLGAPATEDDDAFVAGIAIAAKYGLGGTGVQAMARVYGESQRRVAEMNSGLYHAHVEMPLMASGMTEAEMRERAVRASEELGPVIAGMVLAVYRRHDDRQVTEHIVEHIEAELRAASLIDARQVPPAMCFLDLVGYTRLTDERGDAAAARIATDLAALTQGISGRHDGRPVKWLGDGVMFHFDEPLGAVTASLEMIEALPHAGLPPAHVGISAGPIVAQDGDYFGRTVNLAARIAARAASDEVLVSGEVVDAVDDGAVRFEAVGAESLKGFERPVALFRAARAPDRASVRAHLPGPHGA
jgi:adenylate cyclase